MKDPGNKSHQRAKRSRCACAWLGEQFGEGTPNVIVRYAGVIRYRLGSLKRQAGCKGTLRISDAA